MTDSRPRIWWIGLVALASLEACSGKFEHDNQASAGAGGSAGASASPGSSGSATTGRDCCNVAQECQSGYETLDGLQCPIGATCYALPDCCGIVMSCARFDAPPVDAGPPSDGGDCSLLGFWSTQSAPWNGESTDAFITFLSDGTLTGVPYFTGSWSIAGSTLTIQNTVGADMTCVFPDHWTLTFSGDCATAPLVPIDSGCTGARRYLDWNVTLSRAAL